MKSFSPFVSFLLFGLLLPAQLWAQTGGTAKADLTAIYAEYDKAVATRNVKMIAAFYSPNFALETDQETFNRAESLKNLQDFFATISEIGAAKTTVEKIDQTGGTNVAFVSREIKGLMIFAAGKTREFELTVKAEEYWTKNDKGVWLNYSATERSRILKIDGLEENAEMLESSRTDLEAIYEKIDVALKTRNLGAMFVYWAPDFTELQDGKESTSDDVEAAFDALFAKISVVTSVAHKINNIKTVDNTYVVDVARTIEGNITVKSKKAFFEYNYQAEESWTEKEQGSWKLKTSEIINEKFLINGKEVK